MDEKQNFITESLKGRSHVGEIHVQERMTAN
jgi:hypothetical protein